MGCALYVYHRTEKAPFDELYCMQLTKAYMAEGLRGRRLTWLKVYMAEGLRGRRFTWPKAYVAEGLRSRSVLQLVATD